MSIEGRKAPCLTPRDPDAGAMRITVVLHSDVENICRKRGVVLDEIQQLTCPVLIADWKSKLVRDSIVLCNLTEHESPKSPHTQGTDNHHWKAINFHRISPFFDLYEGQPKKGRKGHTKSSQDYTLSYYFVKIWSLTEPFLRGNINKL